MSLRGEAEAISILHLNLFRVLTLEFRISPKEVIKCQIKWYWPTAAAWIPQ